MTMSSGIVWPRRSQHVRPSEDSGYAHGRQGTMVSWVLLTGIASRVRCRDRWICCKSLIDAQNSGERWSFELLDGTIRVPVRSWSAPGKGD